MVTLEQAKALEPGDYLAFHGSHIYEVLDVQLYSGGITIALRRQDGTETVANEGDLAEAVLRGRKPKPETPAVRQPVEDKPAETLTQDVSVEQQELPTVVTDGTAE